MEDKQPLIYTRYRALNEFYLNAKVALNISKVKFLEKFGISSEDEEHCKVLEEAFQKKVHGENQKSTLISTG